MKITLPTYKLPYIMAIAAHEQLPNSANKPVIISGISMETGIKDDYVVKLNASERMHKEARLRELLAAFIAMEMELQVVEPAVINITQEFAVNQLGQVFHQTVSNSLGYNVGSRYVPKYITLDNTISLTVHQEKAAQNIFAFDLLIQNNDRNYEKPNMITDGQKLIMLDHELAFGFHLVLPFLRNNQPWIFIDSDLVWVNKHCLLKRLKSKFYELEGFSERMTNLNTLFWDRAKELIPIEWFDDEIFTSIKKHINSIMEHRNEFISNLKILLS